MLPNIQQQHSLMYADPAAVAAAETAKALVQAAYIMAMHKPRNSDQARINILEACKRPQFAQRVEYRKPQGSKKDESGKWVKNYIIGPSIRFAEHALREWGNIRTDTMVLYEDTMIRRTKVTITDLETNATFTKEIQITKTVERKKAEDREIVGERTNSYGDKVFILKSTDEELANKEAAAISKAIRNEGLRLIPSDIVDDALETARTTMANQDAQDPQAAKKKILDAFASIGIKPVELEKYLGHGLNVLAPAELQDLRSAYLAITSGEATWSDYVGKGDDHGDDAGPSTPVQADTSAFDSAVKAKGLSSDDQDLLSEYLKVSAGHFKSSVEKVKENAGAYFDKFWTAFEGWKASRKPQDQPAPAEDRKPRVTDAIRAEVVAVLAAAGIDRKQAENSLGGVPSTRWTRANIDRLEGLYPQAFGSAAEESPAEPEAVAAWKCPNTDENVTMAVCDLCKDKGGCPAL